MESFYLIALVVLTSGLAWLLGRGAPFRLARAALPRAFRAALEGLGAALVFWAVNVALGAVLALAIRGIGLGFVSLYVNTDLSLGVLSLVQALVFEAWRHESARLGPPEA